MNIQIIEKQPLKIRVKNKEYEFVKPYYLVYGFEMRKAVVKGSHLVWNIEGYQISYNEIKKSKEL